MVIEIKRIETVVNTSFAKPLTWAVYGLLVAAKHGCRWLASGTTWLRHRYPLSR
jgi:hypothetical protein